MTDNLVNNKKVIYKFQNKANKSKNVPEDNNNTKIIFTYDELIQIYEKIRSDRKNTLNKEVENKLLAKNESANCTIHLQNSNQKSLNRFANENNLLTKEETRQKKLIVEKKNSIEQQLKIIENHLALQETKRANPQLKHVASHASLNQNFVKDEFFTEEKINVVLANPDQPKVVGKDAQSEEETTENMFISLLSSDNGLSNIVESGLTISNPDLKVNKQGILKRTFKKVYKKIKDFFGCYEIEVRSLEPNIIQNID